LRFLRERGRVAPAFQRTVAAVPGVARFFFSARLRAARAGGFARGLLQGGLGLFDLARLPADQFLELAHLALGVEGGPAGAGQRLQAFDPGPFEALDPCADSVPVNLEDVLQRVDRDALGAEQDGVGALAEGKVGVAMMDFAELLFDFFGECFDES
jgi:hypothetical protein